MRKRTKILLPATALALGLGAFALTGELGEGTEAYYSTGTPNDYKTGDVYTSGKSAHKVEKKHGNKVEVEGKAVTLSKNSITVDVPFQGKKTFKITERTKVKKHIAKKFEKGMLVEVEARNGEATEIDVEKSVEAEGILVEVTEQDVTLEQKGVRQTFNKAAGFHIDTDDYSGTLEGLHAEIKMDAKFEVKKLEIEEDKD